jgi:hypothetical protein
VPRLGRHGAVKADTTAIAGCTWHFERGELGGRDAPSTCRNCSDTGQSRQPGATSIILGTANYAPRARAHGRPLKEIVLPCKRGLGTFGSYAAALCPPGRLFRLSSHLPSA